MVLLNFYTAFLEMSCEYAFSLPKLNFVRSPLLHLQNFLSLLASHILGLKLTF